MYTRRFWVDTETTGPDPRKHFAFQIAYLIEERGKILLQRSLEMRPDNYDGFEFIAGAQKVHDRTREQITALPPESEQYRTLIADLEQFGGEKLTVAGYGVDSHIGFLKALFYGNRPAGSRCGDYYKYFDAMPFDVLQFAQGLRVGGIPRFNRPDLQLETLYREWEEDTPGDYTAMGDILKAESVLSSCYIVAWAYSSLNIAGYSRCRYPPPVIPESDP